MQSLLSVSAAQASSPTYQVLARKYRPQNFAQVLGQDVLVRVLTQGLQTGRLPHAFIFTGTRGVGKTSTARILARALNCTGRDLKQTVEPCGQCGDCQAILKDRHMDVIEMDAASRTSVEDIREIIEAAKYKAVQAAYKVYIIDEVHMLSKSAFNAILKTLEEPPAHVVFIFATTEIRKVPQTILSRCMRFDLKRFTLETLRSLLIETCQKEDVPYEDHAITLLAQAAAGSARDAMSLLDQAMTHGMGQVKAAAIADMLGLCDTGKVLQLFGYAMRGEDQLLLELALDLYQRGADPMMIMQDMVRLVYSLTILKICPQQRELLALQEQDLQVAQDLIRYLNMPQLTRAWQLLLKGMEEIGRAPIPLQALQMILLRLAYVQTLPTPDQGDGKGAPPSPITPSKADVVPLQNKSASSIPSFADIVALVRQQREPVLASYLEHDVHVVSYTNGKLVLRLSETASPDLIHKLRTILRYKTGQSWTIETVQDGGAETLYQQKERELQEKHAQAKADPVVAKALETFPGATLTMDKQS